MNARFDTRIAAERFALRIRWVLILAAILLVGSELTNPVVIGLIALLIGSNFAAYRFVRDIQHYEKVGERALTALRFIDGGLVIGASFIPGFQNSNLWALSIPIFVAHALVSRSMPKVAALAVLMATGHLAGTFLTGAKIGNNWVSLVAVFGGAATALVLAWFQARDERLTARDSRLKTVLACGSGLGSNANLRETITSTLRSAILETRANCGYVMLFPDENRQSLLTEAAFSEDGSFEFPETLATGQGLSGYVAQTGQPIAISAKDADNHQFDGMTAGVRAAVSVPLSTRGFGGSGQSNAEQVLGVMTLLDVHHEDAFPSEDMDLLQALCSLLAVAVSNARMEERRRSTFLRTLESLATALEARDEYTRGHSQRVCELSQMIGEKMGLGIEALEELRVGTILHDIGKIGVPDAILLKPGRLTEDEWAVMRQHPRTGYDILATVPQLAAAAEIMLSHEEHFDGSGYPRGLRGEAIPRPARLFAVIDTLDAMTSNRP